MYVEFLAMRHLLTCRTCSLPSQTSMLCGVIVPSIELTWSFQEHKQCTRAIRVLRCLGRDCGMLCLLNWKLLILVCGILNTVWKPCYLSRHLLNFWTVLHRRHRDGLAIRERREKTLLHYITLHSVQALYWCDKMSKFDYHPRTSGGLGCSFDNFSDLGSVEHKN